MFSTAYFGKSPPTGCWRASPLAATVVRQLPRGGDGVSESSSFGANHGKALQMYNYAILLVLFMQHPGLVSLFWACPSVAQMRTCMSSILALDGLPLCAKPCLE